MSIGYSLVHTKDYTDIFIDLDEMILCPWASAGLSFSHLELGLSTLLSCYVTAVHNTGSVLLVLVLCSLYIVFLSSSANFEV